MVWQVQSMEQYIKPEDAKKLYDKGLISEATYNRVNPPTTPVAFAPTPTGIPDVNQSVEPVAPVVFNPTPSGLPEQNQSIEPIVPVYKDVVAEKDLSTTTSSKKITQGAVQAQKALEAGMRKEAEANAMVQAVASEKAKESFALNQEQQRIENEASANEQALRQKGQDEINNRLSSLDNQVTELSNRKYDGYWSNKGTGDKIVSAISVALGAYGSSITGGKNFALDIINKAMDDDFAHYQDITNNKLKAIENSRLNINEKRKLQDDLLQGLQAKRESDIRVVKNKIDNISNKLGDKTAQANLAMANAQLDQKLANSRANYENQLATSVTNTVNEKITRQQVDPITGNVIIPGAQQGMTSQGKPMSEGQAKSQGFMQGAAEAEKILGSTKVPENSKLRVQSQFNTLSTIPVVGKSLEAAASIVGITRSEGDIFNRLNDEDKKYLQAQSQWIQNVLRKESGAAISPEEYKGAADTYFPQVGDSTKIIKQKEEMRKKKVEQMKIETGNTDQKLPWENEDPKVKMLRDKGYSDSQIEQILKNK